MADYPANLETPWADKLRAFNFVAMNPDGTLKSAPTFVNPKSDPYSATGDGVTDDEDAILAAADDLATTGTLWLPTGIYRTGQIAFSRMIHILGENELSTWLVPKSDLFASHLVDLSLGSYPGSNRGYYGASIRDIGIDMMNAPDAKGILIGVNTGHARVKNVWTQGGAVGIENHGTNTLIADCTFMDATVHILINGDTGSEIRIDNTTTARNSVGTTEYALKVVCSTDTPNKGAIRLNSLVHQSGTTGGVETEAGWLIESAFHTSMPVFADRCEIDNITGGGPCIEIIECDDFSFSNGWANGENGVAVFNGVDNAHFSNNVGLRGGGVGTFIFETWPELSFVDVANTLPSNPIYTVPDSAPPHRSFFLHSHIPTDAPLDVCNLPDRLEAAIAPELGFRWFGDRTRFGATAGGFSIIRRGVATLVAGSVSVADTTVDSATTVVIPQRAVLIGAAGVLSVAVTTGVGFTITSTTAETSTLDYFVFERT